MTIMKRGDSFQLDVMINRVRHRSQFRTRAEAKQHETSLRSQAANATETNQASNRLRSSKGITIANLCVAYIASIERRHELGKRMTLAYKESLDGIVRNWVIGGVPFYQNLQGREMVFEGGLGSLTLAEIDEDDERVETFLDDIALSGVSVKTVRTIRQVLGRVLQPAVKKGYLSYNVATELNYFAGRGAKLRGKVTPPSPDLVAALVEEAGDFGLYIVSVAPAPPWRGRSAA